MMRKTILQMCIKAALAALAMFVMVDAGILRANNIIVCKASDTSSPVTGTFNFVIDSTSFSLAVGACKSFLNIGVGDHTVTETQSGTAISSITVTPPDRADSIDLITGTVIADAENVAPDTTITFTNKQGGCPATIGFWKHHAFPNSVQTSGLTIGGVSYSASDLLTILNNNGGNAVVILGKQLVGALLNLAAGAKHNATADGAILTAETLLSANSLNLLTSVVDPSSALGQALLAPAAILDGYNSADFHTCTENSGLILGS
jgi:hypothetical protein